MKTGFNLILAICVATLAASAQAQPRLPTATEISTLKKLAAQSVLHVETSLKKIDHEGPVADASRMRREVSLPAAALLKDWRASKLSDAVMASYSSCESILGDIQGYSAEAVRPPQYHLSEFAQQKIRFIKEDLGECRKLCSETPDFHFAH